MDETTRQVGNLGKAVRELLSTAMVEQTATGERVVVGIRETASLQEAFFLLTGVKYGPELPAKPPGTI